MAIYSGKDMPKEDTAMRLFAENSGAQVYAVDYKLAPEYQFTFG